MKKIIYSIIALLTISTSCEDYLEEDPKIASPDNFPKTEEDVLSLFGASLNHLHNTGGYFERALMFMVEVAADHSSTKRNATDDRGALNFYTFDSDNGENDRAWRELYLGINEMNFIISALEETSEPWMPPYLGAAKAWRAYLYSDLVQYYGDVPIFTRSIEAVSEATEAMRQPTSEVYALIIRDLTDAEVLLEGHEWDLPGLPGETFAKTALARVYMTMAGEPVNDMSKWAMAAQKAKEVKTLGRHALVKPYSDLWQLENRNNEEIILAGQRSLVGGATRSLINNRTRPRNIGELRGAGEFTASLGLYNRFSPNDLRRSVSVQTEFIDSVSNPRDTTHYTELGNSREAQPYYSKYWDSDRAPEDWRNDERRNSNAIPIFRYAEVLLMIAEADNEANGPTAEAYDAINEVRDRAGLPPLNGLSKEQFRDSVRLERELELCMEGKRRFDLVRWGTFLEVMSQDEFAADNVRPHHVLFPIPLNERRLNNKITQNAGYEDAL